MSSLEQRAGALRRSNFYAFMQSVFRVLHPDKTLVKAPYLEAMCFALQEVAEEREQRLLVTVPPRHLKSECASVALAAWLLGRDPALKIIVASYGEDLARLHAGHFRKVIESPMYQNLFPGTRIDPRANRADEMRTTRGGGRKAVSLGGPVTGFGADVIIIDDLMKAQDALSERRREEAREYFEQTLHSRLDSKSSGRIIAVQQRLHEADFAAYLIEKNSYRHLNLPATAESEQRLPLYHRRTYNRDIGDLLRPELETRDALEQIRKDVGAYAFSAQYQQNPTPADSEHLRLDRMTLIDHPPERDDMLMVVQSWDTAIKDSPHCDFSVCTTWGWRDRWHLLDVHRNRHDFPALKAAALAQRKLWRADLVIVEDSSNGTALVHQFRIEGDTRFHLKRVKDSKLERFIAQTDMLQSTRVALPTKAPWFEGLKHELFVFPHGRYDDQVDSVTQFLDWAQRRGRAVLSTYDPQVPRRPASRQRPPGRPVPR